MGTAREPVAGPDNSLDDGHAAVDFTHGFQEGQMAFDLIYMYPETVFMQAARQGGGKRLRLAHAG